MSKHDEGDYSEADLVVKGQKDHAAGPTAVAVSMKRSLDQMGAEAHGADPAQAQPGRGLRLHELRVARPRARATGTPPSSARTAPRRSPRRRPATGSTPEFFAEHSIAELDAAHRATGSASRAGITHPMVKRPGATHYEPIDWDDGVRR